MTSPWQPISTAPKDGTWILARVWVARYPRDRYSTRKTAWNKTSHLPIWGWVHGRDVEQLDLWHPTEWRPIKEKK